MNELLDQATPAADLREASHIAAGRHFSPNAAVVAVRAQTPLRILHTVSSLQLGGMEQFVLRIASHQQRAGHRVSVMAMHDGPLKAEAESRELDACVLRGGMARRVAGAALHVARFRPYVIHAHNPSSLHYASLGRRVCGARIVFTHHGQGRGNARIPGAAEWRMTDVVATVSRDTARHTTTLSGRPDVRVIHNGVQFTPASRTRESLRAELCIPMAQLVCTIVARIDGLKGHADLLRAWAGLSRDTVERLVLLVVGDGVERGAMERLAANLNLGPQSVRFLGFRDDVPDLLGASDILLLPSLSEGMPLSLLEGMSHGLPIIASEVGGIPELVTDGVHGLLTPVGDPSAVSRAISRLAADPALRRSMGQAGQDRVRCSFSFEAMATEYETVYRGLLKRPAMLRG